MQAVHGEKCYFEQYCKIKGKLVSFPNTDSRTDLPKRCRTDEDICSSNIGVSKINVSLRWRLWKLPGKYVCQFCQQQNVLQNITVLIFRKHLAYTRRLAGKSIFNI